MLRGVSVLFDESLYLLETGDDALLAWRASAFLLRFREFAEFRA
jgi:hypothetical protein